jgi:UDP-glucose-4-epimerase GalE
MAATGARRIVFSSSCAVYGIPDVLPVAEDAALRPMNPYGESKLLSERLLPWFEEAHGIRSAILRYFNAAGAADDGSAGEDWTTAPNLIPIVLKVAAGRLPELHVNGRDHPTPDGSAIRDYIHVEDLAEAHLRALSVVDERDASIVVNVGTGRGASVLEVLEAARRVTGRPIQAVDAPRRAGDPPAVWADTRHAADVLGWTATRTLDDILDSAWRWHSAHPAGYEPAA